LLLNRGRHGFLTRRISIRRTVHRRAFRERSPRSHLGRESTGRGRSRAK
jgi:hypothetical protein